MTKVQTRRSISVRGSTYAVLVDYAAANSISVSDFVEQRIAEWFAANGKPPATIDKSRHIAGRLDYSEIEKIAQKI